MRFSLNRLTSIHRPTRTNVLLLQGFKFSESEYADVYAHKMAAVCGGIYLFFLTERGLTLLLQHLEV